MIQMKCFLLSMFGVSLWLLATVSQAYEVRTHRLITEIAFDRAISVNGDLFARLGIVDGPLVKLLPGSYGISKLARDLMSDGAEFEDSNGKFFHHFYNPLTGLGLPPGYPSPDWGLLDRGMLPGQGYAFRNARQNYYEALTKPMAQERDTALGATLEDLGHVAHLIQDMAQPQHVRNDGHFAYAEETYSRYEKFTDDNAVRPYLPRDGYRNAYIADEPGSLRTPRAFWHSGAMGVGGVQSGKGLAEFTNRNFVSAGTNFSGSIGNLLSSPGFPMPDPTSAVVGPKVDAHSLNPSLPFGDLQFIGTPINETLFTDYPPSSNAMTSTFSVFDQDLKVRGASQVFALNNFNFLEAHKYLIPRAVAYSAGMVDFFFRGDINIAIDPDHMGKYVIQNFSSEPMKGTFELYYDAADGTRKHATGATWGNMSIPAKDAAGNPGKSTGIAINVPSDAQTSGKFILVFNGDLGDEKKNDGGPEYGYGAVVGRVVTLAPTEGLYVVGIDNAGYKISFRVDEFGTHLLTGHDPQGGMHFAAFDPIINGTYIGKRAYHSRQARFLSDGYRIQSLASDGGHFVRDPFTQNVASGTYYSWVAQSGDPSLGWFTFEVGTSGPNSGILRFTRTFTDAQGAVQTVTGSVPLPPLPYYDASHDSVNYQTVFANNKAVISTDGLRLYGLMTTTVTEIGPNPGAPYLDVVTETHHQISLNITLGVTPAVAVTEDATLARVSTYDGYLTDTGFTDMVDLTACGCGVRPGKRHGTHGTVNLVTGIDRQWVGIFNTGLATFDIVEDLVSHDDNSHDLVITYTGGGDCHFLESIVQSDTLAQIGHWTFGYNFASGAVTSVRFNDSRGPATVYDQPNPCLGEVVGNPPPQPWCGGAAVDCATSHDPAPPLIHTSDIKDLEFAMTASSSGAVFSKPDTGDGKHYIFRGIDLGAKPFVGDASPLGEIFFATTDMSVIIHESANNRMPAFVPPPNLIKITGAAWF